MALTSVQRAIIYTLAYSHQWQWPLLADELHRRILVKIDDDEPNSSNISSGEISRTRLVSELKLLQTQGLVTSKQKLWALKGFEDTFAYRQSREVMAIKKWSEVQLFLHKARRIPWIKAVFVTGALAVNNVDLNDDVDFMIVTEPDRLWLTRLAVAWIAILAGKRRTWNGFEPNSWCFNLWLSTDELGTFAQRQSVYTAYELHQMQCVYDTGGVERELWRLNAWVSEYLPNGINKVPHQEKMIKINGRNRFLTWLNTAVFQLQHWYMLPHQTREVVTPSQAFFHPRNTLDLVYKGWVAILQLFAAKL